MNTSIIRYILGHIIKLEGFLMLLPCVIAVIYNEKELFTYLAISVVCILTGSLFTIKKAKDTVFYLKEGCIATALSWIVLSFFGALPFIIFVIVPSLFVDLLASTPAFMRNWMGKETVEMLTSLFDGTIKIAFSSSAIVAFICVLATFGFGFYYSAKRRELKRKIREEKLEQMKSGGLY